MQEPEPSILPSNKHSRAERRTAEEERGQVGVEGALSTVLQPEPSAAVSATHACMIRRSRRYVYPSSPAVVALHPRASIHEHTTARHPARCKPHARASLDLPSVVNACKITDKRYLSQTLAAKDTRDHRPGG